MFILLPSAAAETLSGVEYSRPNGQSLLFDAEIPEGDGPFPAAIVVHGGGWVRGDRRTEVEPLFEPLSKAGIAWFSIDYRLAQDPLSFGLAIHDVEAAVRFVCAHAADYRIDPARIALIGESAGGHLAAMAALNPDLPVKTVVAFYAPMNLTELAEHSTLIPDAVRQNVRVAGWGGLILARLSQLSPIDHVRAGMPPFLFVHGTGDPLVPLEQSFDMCERMTEFGNSCKVVKVAGAGHGLRRWRAAAYQPQLLNWLKERL